MFIYKKMTWNACSAYHSLSMLDNIISIQLISLITNINLYSFI